MTGPWRAIGAWALITLALAPFARRFTQRHVAVPLLGQGEASEVNDAINATLHSPLANSAILLMSGLDTTGGTERWRARIREIVTPLALLPGVTATISPATSLDTLLASRDGWNAIALIGLDTTHAGLVDSLRSLTRGIERRLHDAGSATRLEWSGTPMLLDDLVRFATSATRRAELRALPLTLAAALLAFAAPTALLALFAAICTAVVSLGAVALLLPGAATSTSVRMVVPLISLALSIDYSLCLTRWRGASRATAVRTVLTAAAVVMIGFLALLFAPNAEIRSVAPAGALTALICAACTTTLISGTASAQRIEPSVRWRRWGEWVVGHARLVAPLAALPLLLLAWQVRHVRLLTPIADWLPPSMESAQVLRELVAAGRGGAAAESDVIVRLDSVAPAFSVAGWSALQRLTATLASLPDVATVRSITTIGTGDRDVTGQLVPPLWRRTLVSDDGRTALLVVVPKTLAAGSSVLASVRTLARQQSPPIASLAVGGLPALALDYQAALVSAIPIIVLLIAVATAIAVTIVLQAPLVALKAVVLNALVACAAIGAAVLVYQDGVIPRWLGGRAGDGFLLPTVPLIAFAIAFGISMDYELFLLAGVIDARRDGATDHESIVQGVTSGGALITRAALVTVALLVAFAVSDFRSLATTGFVLATALVLDVTLVRLALAPAILTLAGRWNWWPADALARRRNRS